MLTSEDSPACLPRSLSANAKELQTDQHRSQNGIASGKASETEAIAARTMPSWPIRQQSHGDSRASQARQCGNASWPCNLANLAVGCERDLPWMGPGPAWPAGALRCGSGT